MSDGPRRALLDRVMADVATHGLADRSLRDLGTAVGSSHRMLHYHFGSRDGLVAAIAEEVELRQRRQLRELAATHDEQADALRAAWASASSPPLRPFVHLFFEALTQAFNGRPGTEGFLESLSDEWLGEGAEIIGGFARGHRHDERVDRRLAVAVTRGLLVELMATGDLDAATETHERFVELMSAAGK